MSFLSIGGEDCMVVGVGGGGGDSGRIQGYGAPAENSLGKF